MNLKLTSLLGALLIFQGTAFSGESRDCSKRRIVKNEKGIITNMRVIRDLTHHSDRSGHKTKVAEAPKNSLASFLGGQLFQGLNIVEKRNLLNAIGRSISSMHKWDFIHGNIRPENIIVTFIPATKERANRDFVIGFKDSKKEYPINNISKRDWSYFSPATAIDAVRTKSVKIKKRDDIYAFSLIAELIFSNRQYFISNSDREMAFASVSSSFERKNIDLNEWENKKSIIRQQSPLTMKQLSTFNDKTQVTKRDVALVNKMRGFSLSNQLLGTKIQKF